MSVKQLQRKFDLAQAKLKSRQADVLTLKAQTKELKDQLTAAKAAAKEQHAAKTAPK